MAGHCELRWFASADNTHQVAHYLWRPRQPVRGVVQLVHGMREHMGRYGDFASFLSQQGFAVFGHDHLGHGRTAAKEDYGHFGERDGVRILLKDCHRAALLARKEYPQQPLFLLGHSMGSLIGRLYILHYARELAGFICMGTAGNRHAALFGRGAAEAAARLLGSRREGQLLDKLAFGSYADRFVGEQGPAVWLSRDPEVVENYLADDHCTHLFTNRGFSDLFELVLAVSRKQWAGRVDKALPIFLLSGTEDPVGEYGRGVVQVYERLKLAGVLDVKCKLYPQARHELLNELNKEEVYYDICQWMEERLSPCARQ